MQLQKEKNEKQSPALEEPIFNQTGDWVYTTVTIEMTTDDIMQLMS